MLAPHAPPAAGNLTVSNTSQPQTSKPPAPPSSRGNLKYVLIGLLFLVGAIALVMLAGDGDNPAPAPAPPPEVQRVNPMEQPELDLEEPTPEEPVAEEPPAKTKPRRVGGEWECSGDLPNARKVVDENRRRSAAATSAG
jgi:hypothetical protein